MENTDVVSFFDRTLRENPNKSEAVAAIETLMEFIRLSKAETMQGMVADLREATTQLTKTDHGLVTSISSGCDLFLRFITMTSLDYHEFKDCKDVLQSRGKIYLQYVAASRKKIANFSHQFIRDGATILTHSRSRVVFEVLKKAHDEKKRFTVYITESLPDRAGLQMHKELEEADITCISILDAAVGYIMEKVDMVLAGAEGVVESGGIINKIGTYTMALAAKEMNKPVYIVAESFKFARLFPLNQQDVPNKFKYKSSLLKNSADLTKEHPMVDYTPPSYITLLFTDLGILTPSAVSDELIKLYL